MTIDRGAVWGGDFFHETLGAHTNMGRYIVFYYVTILLLLADTGVPMMLEEEKGEGCRG